MIIWIDGTYGVGKTTVSMEIKKRFTDCEIEVLEADVYYEKFTSQIIDIAKQKNCMPNIGGTLPQNNIRFLQSFKKMIEEKIQNKDKKILVDMSLTMTECKENLFDVLLDNGKRIIHIILVGEEDTIKFRIKNDNKRDKQLALEELKYNLCFLKENFDDAIRIKTDKREISDIADEIIQIINHSQENNYL